MAGLALGMVSSEEIDEEAIEKLKEGDILESTFTEFAEHSPELYEALIAERDRYMASRLREDNHGAEGRKVLVVFLGFLAVTSPSAAYFSHVLKQYSGELLVASLLLPALLLWHRKPTPRRFLLLLALTVAGLCLAYGLVLLLPAVLLVVFPPSRRWWTGGAADPGDWTRWIHSRHNARPPPSARSAA